MNHYYESTLTSSTRFAYRLGWKPCPTTVPPPKFLGSPASQTSPIFELPNELILSILSRISPDPPQHAGHYARFRVRHSPGIDDYHQQRVEFLRPLSMTCRAMRLRLVPWIWEHLKLPPSRYWNFTRNLNTIADVLHGDTLAATSVRFLTLNLTQGKPTFPPFVKCLKSLPNLHTLKIGWMASFETLPLENALDGVELPQIKTLILPPAAHPLLQHCCDVEDVVCMVRYETAASYGFIESFESIRKSKIKRLAIPLFTWIHLPRFVAVCPGLIELTIICPSLVDAQTTETGAMLNLTGRAREAISELVVVCKALPDFDTLQVVYFPVFPSSPTCRCRESRCGCPRPSVERRQTLKKYVKGVKDWTMDCLKSPKPGCLEGEERKRTTLRVIKLTRDPLRPMFYRGSVKIEEHEVQGFDRGVS